MNESELVELVMEALEYKFRAKCTTCGKKCKDIWFKKIGVACLNSNQASVMCHDLNVLAEILIPKGYMLLVSDEGANVFEHVQELGIWIWRLRAKANSSDYRTAALLATGEALKTKKEKEEKWPAMITRN